MREERKSENKGLRFHCRFDQTHNQEPISFTTSWNFQWIVEQNTCLMPISRKYEHPLNSPEELDNMTQVQTSLVCGIKIKGYENRIFLREGYAKMQIFADRKKCSDVNADSDGCLVNSWKACALRKNS